MDMEHEDEHTSANAERMVDNAQPPGIFAPTGISYQNSDIAAV